MNKKNVLPIWFFLFLLNGICLCLGFFLIISQCLTNVKDATKIQTEQNLKTFSYSVKAILQNKEEENIQGEIDKYLKLVAGNNKEFRITLVASDGSVIADSDAGNISTLQNHSDRIEIIHALNGQEGSAIRHSTVNEKDVMYYAIPFTYKGNTAALRLSIPMESAVFFTLDEAWNIVFWGVVILLLVLGASFFISAYIVRKINILREATVQYQKGNFAFRPMITSPKELMLLGESFSDMADTIQENFDNLEHLERVRTDFVANVSHELKTPITSIKGFLETLLDGAIDDKDTARHFLEIMSTQTNRLSNIIEDLLSLSRLEGDNQIPEMTDENIVLLTKKIVESEQYNASEKNITLKFDTSSLNEISPIIVALNEGLYSQAVTNILDNSIKYCPENSEVVCSIDMQNVENQSKPQVLVSIEDNGPGIPDSYKDRIFERFFRVDKSRSRATGGTGLGLSIALHIIKLHGGSICEKERKDGKKGARFEILLPLKR